MLSMVGIASFFIDWKSGLCAAAGIAAVYFFQKLSGYRFLFPIIGVMLVSVYFLTQLLNIELVLVIASLLFQPFIFFVKPCYEEYKNPSDFEIFYWDKRKIKCLVTLEDSDYKGYMLNPRSYVKEFPSARIKTVTFTGNTMTIAVDNLLIRPKELSSDDVLLIRGYMDEDFPDLLQNTEAVRENIRIENRFYWHKLIIFSPVFIGGMIIYFFADNGRNKPLTYTCLLLMIISCFLIYYILRKKIKNNN
jgi:hypothetical protein